jgi:hypothetical protein
MEEQKTVLLSLEFDTEEGLKRAANFRSAIDADKEALAELNKVIKKNGEQSQEQLIQREKLEQSIKANTKSRTDELRALENYIKATKNAIGTDGKYNGSINNLRGNLGFLTAKWNDLTKSERENAQVGGVLQKEIKQLSDQLKEMEGSVGDNRRSVGGYLDAIRQAPGAMGKFKAGVDGISMAMKANPLGFLVSLLPQITALFNSSGDSADFFAKVMGSINAVIQVGVKYLLQFAGFAVDAGKKAVTAFSSPKKLLTDLVDFMKTNLLNRFKAFAVILEGIQTLDFRKVTDGVIQMGTGVTDATTKIANAANAVSNGVKQIGTDINNAASAGANLEAQLDKLAERERKLAVEASNTRKEINALSIQARSRAKSEEEKLAIIEKADKLQLGLNDKQLKLERDRLKLLQEQNKISTEDSDVQDQRLSEQLTKINELEESGANIREKFQVRKDALADAAAEKEKKRYEERVKQFEKDKERVQEELKLFQEVAERAEERLEKELGFERDRQAERNKLLDEDTKRLDKELKGQLERSKAAITIAEREAADKIALKEKEYQILVGFTNAASNLAAALANENSELAEFQKAVTLFQIGLASAEALTKGIAASQALPFPANLVAMGTSIATITANLLQAKQLITAGDAPKYKAAEGGILNGPSHSEGGITGTGRFANIEVEGGEAIITKRATAMFAPILSALNVAGGGKPLAPTNFAALGGFIPSGATGSNAGALFDYDKLANKMISAIERMPAPVVGISDIKAKSAEKDNRMRRVTLGA